SERLTTTQRRKLSGSELYRTVRAAYSALLARSRYLNLCQALKDRSEGKLVVLTRLPQYELPGILDGPSNVEPRSAVGRWMRTRELSYYARMKKLGMVDLVFLLEVSLETAIKRRPECSSGSLAMRIQSIPRIHWRAASSVAVKSESGIESAMRVI